MLSPNEIEEIIYLINKDVNINLLSFELDIPIEELQKYKAQLALRKLAYSSVRKNEISSIIKQLENFIVSSDYNIVEKFMLLTLNNYANKTNVSDKDLQILDDERKKIGLLNTIEQILKNLGLSVPKRKNNNNTKKSTKLSEEEDPIIDDTVNKEQPIPSINYDKIIQRHKNKILSDPKNSQNARNLLAFAYFNAGRINEARTELMSLIQDTNSFLAYRQLIYLELSEKNYEEAKIWAYETLDRFPEEISIRQQLISIAKKENDTHEIIIQLKEILKLHPDSIKFNSQLKKAQYSEGR